MNRYPAKPFMDEMAQYGRYGDSMLVHMNPVEVAGIAALSPTGQLTTNPMTGQPEAFLPLLAPALGWLGGQMGLGVLGSAVLTGAGTAAVTGDLKRGLIAGLTAGAAGGIGDLLGGTADAGVEAATDAVRDAVSSGGDIMTTIGAPEAATNLSNVAANAIPAAGPIPDIAPEITAEMSQALSNPVVAPEAAVAQELASRGVTPVGGETIQGMQLGAENLSDRLGGFGNTMVAGTGMGQLAQMDYMDEMEAMRKAQEAESEGKKRDAYEQLQAAYAAAQPGVMRGLSPYRSSMSYNTPMPYVPGMAEGGDTTSAFDEFLASLQPTEREQQALSRAGMSQPLTKEDQSYLEDFYNRQAYGRQQIMSAEEASRGPESIGEYFGTEGPATGRDAPDYVAPQAEGTQTRGSIIRQTMDRAKANARAAGMAGMGAMGGNIGYGGIDPISVQAGLRGREVVAPPKDYMTGFEPEYSYFQDDASNPMTPSREFRPTKQGFGTPVFDPMLERDEYQNNVSRYLSMLNAPGSQSVIDAGPQTERTDRWTPDQAVSPTGPKDPGDVTQGPPPGTAGGPGFTNSEWLSWMKSQGALPKKDLDWFGRWFQEAGIGSHNNWVTGNVANFDWESSDMGKDSKRRINAAMNYMKPFWGEKQPAEQGETEEQKAAGGILGFYPGGYTGGVGYSGYNPDLFRNVLPKQMTDLGEVISKFGTDAFNVTDATEVGDKDKGATAPNMPVTQKQLNSAQGTLAGNAALQNMLIKQMLGGNVFSGSGGIQNTSTPVITMEEWQKAGGGLLKMEEGGEVPERSKVPLKSPMGTVEVPAGGIAEVSSGMSATPSETEVGLLAAALTGQMENSDVIIQGFLDQYGPEVFQIVRDYILQALMPDAQTSGMIRGEGGGMDDMVPGMIGSQQPVAVSPGEYIIPADVVSDLGDGSSDAGAEELDAMLGRVRMARGGTADQPPPIDAQSVMPV